MKTVACVVVLGLVAMAANAAIVPDARLTLSFDAGGNAVLQNMTAAPLSFDGYEIHSAAGNLDAAGWVSIQDAFVLDGFAAATALGFSAGGMVEIDLLTTSLLSELNGAATLQANASWSIGVPASPASEADLSFFWHEVGQGGETFEGGVVPEPTTMALLGLGLVGFIARKKR